MGVLADHQLRKAGVVYPFTEGKTPGRISYGVSSYGYDVRLHADVRAFERCQLHHVIDVKDGGRIEARALPIFSQRGGSTSPAFADEGDWVVLPALSHALARTVEEIAVPIDCLGIVMGKSTYARAGLIVNTTPLEPGWHGTITLELFNSAPAPLKLYVGEGIAQVYFLRGEYPCERDYIARGGKYDGQTEITLPRV